MVAKKLGCVAIIVWGLLACKMPTTTPTKTVKSTELPSVCKSLEKPIISDKITIQETTQAELSKHLVGVSNIWERELRDDKGVVAPRMAAELTIYNIASEQSRFEDVFAGRVISVGSDGETPAVGDRYFVVDVEYGDSSYGAVTLCKIQSEMTTK